jgi:hypothetical protein
MARAERRAAWSHARRLPGRTSAVVDAFARRYPLWALALAAGWFLRPRRRITKRWSWKPISTVLTALSAQVLAQVPRILGLVGSRHGSRSSGTKRAASRRGGANPTTSKAALVQSSSHGC